MASTKPSSGPHILTANALMSGRVVYWTGKDWSKDVDAALQAQSDEDILALEARGAAEEHVNMVVGAYLVPLADAVSLTAKQLRERHRIAGPSIAIPNVAFP